MNSINTISRVRLLSVPVDNVDILTCVHEVSKLISKNDKRNYILAVNAEKVIALQNDSTLKKMFEDASLVIPDGISAVLAMRYLYMVSAKRVPGIDLMLAICEEAATNRYKIFVYGSRESANEVAVKKLNRLYPGILIVGRCDGYSKEERMEELINQINESEADILFVALGSPKQEKWIGKYLPRLNVKVCQGVGGALDVISGGVKRAPWLMRRAGLEWLYRLVSEPKRIRRQTVLPLFVLKVFAERIRISLQ